MIQVANAPCSWGIIENISGDRGQYKKVIDEIQETGYIGTELGDWGFMPTDPEILSKELDERNLQLLGSWISVRLHTEDEIKQSIENAVRTAQLLAAVGGESAFGVLGNDPYTDPMRNQYTGRIQPKHGMSEEQWEMFAGGVNRVAKAVMDETGLRCVVHHHTGTWVETPAETDRLLNMTDQNMVGLCFDTGHWAFGGGDPVEGIKKYADRIWHVHFKDCDPDIASKSRVEGWSGTQSVENAVFCELGQGQVDFPAVLKTLKDINYDGWIVVEQDVFPGMGTPKESANRNREYLRSIGL